MKKNAGRLVALSPWIICGLGALFYSYEYLLRITPTVMTADLMRFFHINNGALGNLSAFYYYIYTPMQLVVGVLMDRYGPRRLLTLATLSCVTGSFLFAATDMLFVAEIGRFLVGFGSAFAFVGVLKLATIWLPQRYFAPFAGLTTALGMVGAMAGVIIMTHFVTSLGWRETIFASAILGIFIALLIAFFVRDIPDNTPAHIHENHRSQNIWQVIQGLITIIKAPQMWLIGVIGGLLYLPASAFAEMWGIPYLINAHHMTPQQAAFGVSMVFIGWIIGGPISGWLSEQFRKRNTALTVGALFSCVFFTILLYNNDLSSLAIYAILFFFGIFSSAQILVFAVGREMSSPKFAASALAFTNMTVMLSGVIFQPMVGMILDYRWNGQMANGVQLFTTHDYTIALLAIPFGLLLSAILSHFTLRETHCKSLHKESKAAEKEVVEDGAVA